MQFPGWIHILLFLFSKRVVEITQRYVRESRQHKPVDGHIIRKILCVLLHG